MNKNKHVCPKKFQRKILRAAAKMKRIYETLTKTKGAPMKSNWNQTTVL